MTNAKKIQAQFSAALHWARKRELKLSKQQAADIFGVNRKQYIRIEKGSDKMPIEMLSQIFTTGLKALTKKPIID